LTLQPAFAERDQVKLIEQITHQAPAPLRQHDRRIPKDIQIVVLKSLAKNPSDRFESADEMAAELRRFVENRPIRSRPIPFYQRFWRWCQRNPRLAAANIAAAALTTILAIVSTVAAWNYREQRNEIGNTLIVARASEAAARRAGTEAREELFKALLDRARAGRFSHRRGQRFDSLEALREAAAIGRELRLPPEQFEPLRDEAIACMALPDLQPTGRVITRPPGAGAVFDSTMTRYALRFRDGTIQVRRVADDQEIARFQARHDRGDDVFNFSPDGRYLATTHQPSAALTVWDIDRRTIAVNDPGPVPGGAARFSPASRMIAVAPRDGEFAVYDLATGQPRLRWRGLIPSNPEFSPDGTQIAMIEHGSKKDTCRILDAQTGRLIRSFEVLPGAGQLAWSPDGTTLATACNDRKIFLWDAATGIRKATLEGHINGGIVVAFHPAGTLLASSDWSGELRIWDQILGRPWLNLTGDLQSGFSQDGRIVIDRREEGLTTYQVDPALECRTLAHVSSQQVRYGRPSIRSDGRVLAVHTTEGVVFWDIAGGLELGFLPIERSWHSMFAASGDLIATSSSGVQRWPVHLNPDRGEFRIGPPQQLPLPSGPAEIDADRSGRIVALADFVLAFVATPERTFHVGPLEDCRVVAVSPDGQWLATGRHGRNDARVWRVRDATQVAHLAIEGLVAVGFSPDGKWLMTKNPPCRLWKVGTWQKARQIGGIGYCFSPDSRLMVVQDANRVLRLVEVETGRTLARLENPNPSLLSMAAFSPDGSRLVVPTAGAVHVWDLRAIRRRLTRMGLDWDAPAYSDADPASPTLPPLPPLKVAYGPFQLTGHVHDPKVYEPLIADLETALVRHPDQRRIREHLAHYYNHFAWGLVIAPGSTCDSQRALSLARRAVELDPTQGYYLNTLGVALYRAGRYAEAIAALKKSLAANRGQIAAFDLFFLAMAHHRLAHRAEARDCFDRAVRWLSEQTNLPDQDTKELANFRAEAEAVLGLASPGGELRADMFAPE
jgi:WD40 repeat protein